MVPLFILLNVQQYCLFINVYSPKLALPCHSPSCGSIVAVVGEEVIIQLPEHMQGGPPVWCKHIVVGLTQLSIKVIQHQQLRQQLVCQFVHLN